MKGTFGQNLQLGFQTKVDLISKDIAYQSKARAPRGAKSFSIYNVTHRDNKGNISQTPTGLGFFEVSYFTTRREGQYSLLVGEDD